MKSIFKKVHISYFFIILVLVSFLSGLFRDIIWLFIVLMVHELGHILFSIVFKWNIDRIDINIYGGLITYDDILDKPFFQEFIISISGVLFQSIFYYFMKQLFIMNVVDTEVFSLIKNYHYSVLFFNLLPIIPLDGSKVVFVFLNMFFPYYKSLKISSTISFFSLFVLIILLFFIKLKITFGYVTVFGFVLYKLYEYTGNIKYMFNRFLFERYSNNQRFNKFNLINGHKLINMKRQKNNIFVFNNKYYLEQDVLKKLFYYI